MRRIEHSNPLVGDEEKKALKLVIDCQYLAEGEKVRYFERKIAEYINCQYAMATSTGTAALHLALLVLDVKKGDEVILPNYVCRSVLNAIQYCQAIPVLCDVDKTTYNILPEEVKNKLSYKTKAIIVAHMFGCPAPMDEFKKINVPIIEDCAQSIGAEYKGKRVGSFGDVSIFSFEGTKMITTGEGGMVLTNSGKLFNRLRRLKEPYSRDIMPKYTYRLSDLQAAVGCVQLKKLPQFVRKREQIAKQYMRAFANDEKVLLPYIPKETRHTFHRFILTIKKGNFDCFLGRCQKKGVMVKRPIKPYVLNQYLGIPNKLFPNTAYIMSHCASVPIYPALKQQEVKRIISILRGAMM